MCRPLKRSQQLILYIMLNIFLTFSSRTIMVFHKGKMYRMGNGNIPPFTKEILLLICSVREMFSTCAQAIVKTTAYIVGYRNTAMSKAPTRIRLQLWTTVGSNHVQAYQLEMHGKYQDIIFLIKVQRMEIFKFFLVLTKIFSNSTLWHFNFKESTTGKQGSQF